MLELEVNIRVKNRCLAKAKIESRIVDKNK